MNSINICFLSDEAVATIKANIRTFTEIAKNSPEDNSDFIKQLPEKNLVEKKYTIEDFCLVTSPNGNYNQVDLNNSITLYNALKGLPRHILCDERFWLWIIIYKGYAASLQAMPIESGKNIIRDHWLFSSGKRRGLFFGVMSRSYFKVELTKDDELKDPYELTKFSTEKYERFRNLTWRTYSNNRHVVLGTLKAEKYMVDKYGERVERTPDYYTNIGKYVSQMGSVMLLDTMDEDYVKQRVLEYCKELYSERLNGI